MRPRWPATSTTTPPGWSRRRPTGSGSSPPCRMPHIDESVAETVRALDDLNADGVVLLANNAGTYLGEDGQDDLFAALDARSAVVFIHPDELPGPTVPGMPPFAADFLLDTTRAAYSVGAQWHPQRYPNIRFILGHAGGFVPVRVAPDGDRDHGSTPAAAPPTAWTTSPASISTPRCPRARPHCRPCSRSPNRSRVTFGSDWPFAPVAAGHYFAAGLETSPAR